MKRYVAKLGDVFVVPLGEDAGHQMGCGQLVGYWEEGDAWFSVLFDVFLRDAADESWADIVKKPILYISLTATDAIKLGHWQVVSNEDLPPRLELPAFKETWNFPPEWHVVDYAGLRGRPANASELERLRYRRILNSETTESVLRATLGLEPWVAHLEEMRYGTQPSTREMFGQQ